MTEEELDEVYMIRARIEAEVTELVAKHTKPLTPEQDDLIRIQLTENYRFWK